MARPKPRIRDLSGLRFGKLTALKRLGSSSVGATLWECLCDCGTTTVVTLINLTNNNTKSCGCLKHQPSKTRHNLAGRRFGLLVVLHPVGSLHWMCRCDCGNKVAVATVHLTRDHTKSCGCLVRASNPTESQIDRRWRNKAAPWAKNVVAAANNRCDVCGSTSNLHAHHIMPWAEFVEMRYFEDNGACLCRSCHYKIHRMISAGVSGGDALAESILNNGRNAAVKDAFFNAADYQKGGLMDLKKARHYLDRAIELLEANGQ